MTLPTDWYECDSRFIPGHWQPAVLLDLALSRGIDSHRLLRGSGLFHEDILSGEARLSPQQFLCLIDNARRLLEADDSSFLFGQRLLPGHYEAGMVGRIKVVSKVAAARNKSGSKDKS